MDSMGKEYQGLEEGLHHHHHHHHHQKIYTLDHSEKHLKIPNSKTLGHDGIHGFWF